MLLNFSFLYTDFIAFSLFYQVSVLFNSLTTHPNDFVEVCSAFIQCWLQFFFTSLYFTGKAFAEEVKNTTDLFNAFITSWNFAPTFDSEHTLNYILWAGRYPFGEGWSACTHRPAPTNIFYFFTIKAFYCLLKLTFTWPVRQNKIRVACLFCCFVFFFKACSHYCKHFQLSKHKLCLRRKPPCTI